MLQVLRGSFGANKTYWVSQPQAKGVVIFFPGDQLEHAYAAPEIRRLQDSKIQAQLMAAKFPGCSSVVVMPSRLEGSYACFDHFLEGFTRSGEPLGYPASQLKATSQIASLLEAGLLGSMSHDMTCHLVGFSKGAERGSSLLGAVTSSCWPAGYSTTRCHKLPPEVRRSTFFGCWSQLSRCSLDGSTSDDFAESVCAAELARDHHSSTWDATTVGLPDLDDARRPWVRQEKERFKALLKGNGLPVQEHRYFDGAEPTLLMHFEAIQAMQCSSFM